MSLRLYLPGLNILPGVQTVTEYDTSENCTSIPPLSANNSSRSSIPTPSTRKHRLLTDEVLSSSVPRQAVGTQDPVHNGRQQRSRIPEYRIPSEWADARHSTGTKTTDWNAVAHSCGYSLRIVVVIIIIIQMLRAHDEIKFVFDIFS